MIKTAGIFTFCKSRRRDNKVADTSRVDLVYFRCITQIKILKTKLANKSTPSAIFKPLKNFTKAYSAS